MHLAIFHFQIRIIRVDHGKGPTVSELERQLCACNIHCHLFKRIPVHLYIIKPNDCLDVHNYIRMYTCGEAKTKSTERCSRFEVQKQSVQGILVSTLDQMLVSNGTGQGVRRSKRPVFASCTCCKCSMEASCNLVIWSRSVIRSILVISSRFSEMSDQWRVSLYIVMSQNVMKHLGEGDLEKRRIQTFPDTALLEKFIWKSHRPPKKTFIRGANPGIPYELCDKNVIGLWIWSIAFQKRNVCDMEVETVTLV